MTAQIITFTKPVTRERNCSFCKRPESKVSCLIKSGINDHCICSDCVRAAKNRLETTQAEVTE